MNRKTLHLRTSPSGGWDVILTSGRDLAHFADRDAALAFARHKAQTQQLDLVVHDAQGAVVATEVHDPDLRIPATPSSGEQTGRNGGR